MNAKKILVPTDFSASGKNVLELAAALARDRGASLLVVYVDEPLPIAGEAELYPGVLPSPAELKQMLAEVVPADKSVKCEHKLLAGKAVDQIVKVAEEEKVEFIVMPTHGRTGLTRALMGSVAEQVLRRAPCPVLTLKLPEGSED